MWRTKCLPPVWVEEEAVVVDLVSIPDFEKVAGVERAPPVDLVSVPVLEKTVLVDVRLSQILRKQS